MLYMKELLFLKKETLIKKKHEFDIKINLYKDLKHHSASTHSSFKI